MPSFRAVTASPPMWSMCSWVMMMASSVSGASPASLMRRKSSRQLNPASTKMRVCPPLTTVLLPLEPDASTVNRTIDVSIQPEAVDRYRKGVTRREPFPATLEELQLVGQIRRKLDGDER